MRSNRMMPVAEAILPTVEAVAFLTALDKWAPLPADKFPLAEPPVGALPHFGSDENAELAKVFRAVAKLPTTTDRMAHLTGAILVHQHRLELQIRYARSSGKQPFRAQDRIVHVEARRAEQMIDTLFGWLGALHNRACEAAP